MPQRVARLDESVVSVIVTIASRILPSCLASATSEMLPSDSLKQFPGCFSNRKFPEFVGGKTLTLGRGERRQVLLRTRKDAVKFSVMRKVTPKVVAQDFAFAKSHYGTPFAQLPHPLDGGRNFG
jgi:hypothetical protein